MLRSSDKKMKTYTLIKKISRQLNSYSRDEIKLHLGNNINRIQESITQDFQHLFGTKLQLIDYLVYANDETYRQSATGIILIESLDDYKNFEIRIELLIDHERIFLKITKDSTDPSLRKISKRIRQVMDIEGLSELKKIT